MFQENGGMSLRQFRESFSDNESCQKHLLEQRWRNGFICPRCGYQQAWFLSTRNLFECKSCRHQTSPTAGTIFHKTHVPLKDWYLLIFFMTILEDGVSVSEMQRLLEIGSYKTAWMMAHKIRKAMVERDKRFRLAGLMKLSMSFFSSEAMNRGQDHVHKSVVLCAVAIYKNYKGEDEPGFAHMEVVNDSSAETLEGFLQKVGRGKKTREGKQLMEKILSDGWSSHVQDANDDNLSHYKIAFLNSETADRLIPWINSIIANAKDVILKKHRGISEKYLHAYLSEIVYRLNHRHWEKELFDRLIHACLQTNIVNDNNLV
jgi:transposase-like protein